jgi:hypothetical protein
MIDFANYTPAPAKESIAAPVAEAPSEFGLMMTHLFPGVCDSATFVLVLLAIFIIGTPIVFWLVDKWKREEKIEKKKEGKK